MAAYKFQQLEDPNGDIQSIGNINDSGTVVGLVQPSDGSSPAGFVMASDGTYTNLVDPKSETVNGGESTNAIGINSAGEVVGYFEHDDPGLQGRTFGYLYNSGNYSTIRYPSNGNDYITSANGINQSGEIVGGYEDINGVDGAFIEKNGAFTNLTVNNSPFTTASAVNDGGQVVGFYQSSNSNDAGFVDSNGEITTLDYPNASSTQATGINNQGVIVGDYIDASGVQRGFVYQNDQYEEVPYPDSDAGNLYLTGINDKGYIAGYFAPYQGNTVYFVAAPTLFTTGSDIVDFNNLTSSQLSAVENGADIYDGLGGSDVVALPNATDTPIPGTSTTFSGTFATGSQLGDTYTLTGGSGSYNLQLGAGTDDVTIDGDGSSTITGGSGSGNITIIGAGNNTINGGAGTTDITLSGSGANTLVADSGAFSTVSVGSLDSLQVQGQAAVGDLTDNGSVEVDNALTVSGTLSGSGDLSVDQGATLTLNGTGSDGTIGDLTDKGGVEVDNALTVSGTLSGSGDLSIDQGATLTLNGTGSDGTIGDLTDKGGVEVDNALTVSGTLSGSGDLSVDQGATLTLNGTGTKGTIGDLTDNGRVDIGDGVTLDLTSADAPGSGTIAFISTSGTATGHLELASAAQSTGGGAFANTIGGFSSATALVLDDFTSIGPVTYDTDTSTLTVQGIDPDASIPVPVTETFKLADPSATEFIASPDGDNSVITEVVCFAAGTRIRVWQDGGAADVAVEQLAVGDIAVTASGAHRPIRWIGHRTIDCRKHPRPHEARPVRIAAHVFGPDRPARDIHVSPGHAICVDVLGEVLVPAGALVDGGSVRQLEVAAVTYWHVELDRHDILLAENLPCESYLEMGNRIFFAEFGVVDLQAGPDMRSLATHADFCRPFIDRGPQLDAVKAWLARRLGYGRRSGATRAQPRRDCR